MQKRKLNCATFQVASSMDISGTATADETNRTLRTGKGRSFCGIARLIFLGSLTVIGLCVAVAPLPARADNQDSHQGREDNDNKGIRAEIAALQAQVASLQTTVSALQDQVNTLKTGNTGLQNEINSLQTSNTAVQKELAAVQSNHALLLGPFVNVDPNPEIGVIGPNIIFSGVNIHIVSGSGRTDDNGNRTGLGNLIIGYDEDPINPLFGDSLDGLPIMAVPGAPSPLSYGDRGGSHNLVIGGGNRFTRAAAGGIVVGERNKIEGFGASVSGGFNNAASGFFTSVSGGVGNMAAGQFASVSGGGFSVAGTSSPSVSGGTGASVSGGGNNYARGLGASGRGGLNNVASGDFASVSGGNLNTAGGFATVVIGGQNVTDNKDNSIAPQPPFP
jgi:hypothetical protein